MRKFLILVLASLLLIIFDQVGVVRPIRGGIERLVLPFETKINEIRIQRNKETEKQRNEETERQIAVLESQISTLKKENADIRRLLGAPLPQNWKFLPAKVVGSEEGVLIIDKGRKDNATLGQVAIFENIFVGKITSLGEYISRLETPKSQNLKIEAVVKSPSGEGITARGILSFSGGKLILDRVLPEEQLAEGDLVLTAGAEGIPADLLVGKIKKTQKSSLFQKAEVLPLISYFDLENVFLIIFK